MATIEIDFDVYKALTAKRATESVTHNMVLREILGLGNPVDRETNARGGDGWAMQGVHFPEGTLFQVVYKGARYSAEIKDGRWIGGDGTPRKSPSDAATAITGNNVNGWRFWSFKRPGDAEWRKLRVLQDS